MHQWPGKKTFTETFDEDFWEYIVEEGSKAGINMIILDVGDAVEFGSHPEIADTGAKPWIWSCPLFRHTEEYQKHIDAEEVLISPWQ